MPGPLGDLGIVGVLCPLGILCALGVPRRLGVLDDARCPGLAIGRAGAGLGLRFACPPPDRILPVIGPLGQLAAADGTSSATAVLIRSQPTLRTLS